MLGLRIAVSSLLLLAVSVCAEAAPKYFRVGSGCAYATIQAALEAERASPGSPADFIYVARNQTYAAQDIQIHDQNVFVYGGVDDCVDTSVSGTTSLSGAGGSAKSVMTISGHSQVWLGGLTITKGDNTDSGVGGGINFVGTGTLKMTSTTITNNRAGYGGGINFHGTGNASDVAQLWVNAETLITNNTAVNSGGGIRVEGNALLHVLDPQVWITLNHADGGFGGGVQVLAPASADLGSPGYQFAEFIPLLYQNTAKYGGGLSVNSGGDTQKASVRLFTTNALHPLAIEGNTASSGGGGIYVQSFNADDGLGFAEICGSDFRIAQNSSIEGAAIYGTTLGAHLFLSKGYADTCLTDAATLGAQACTEDNCHVIEGNVVTAASGQPLRGSTVYLENNAYLTLNPVRFHDNHGTHLVRLSDASAGGEARFGNCLISGNTVADDFFTAAVQTHLTITNCTIADNAIGSAVAIRDAGELTLYNTIFGEPGTTRSLLYTGGNPGQYLHVDHLIAMEVASLAQGAHVIQGDPAFVDRSDGNFRLLATSPALDLAATVANDAQDLDGLPRDVDLPTRANGDGPRDLGAYERQVRTCGATDTLFCGDFELY